MSDVSFSTAVTTIVVAVAKLLILGNSLLTAFSLALRVVLVAKLVISGTWSSISLMLAYRYILDIFF